MKPRMPLCLNGDTLQDHLEALDERVYLAEARQRHANAFARKEKRNQRHWAEKNKVERTGERSGYLLLT